MVSKLGSLTGPIYRGWWIVFIAWFALLVNGGGMSYVFNLLVTPMEAELGWGRSSLYGVLTVGGLIAGFLSAPMGPLFDKYGGRVLITVSGALAGTCFLLTGAVQEQWQYYLLIGIGIGVTRPAVSNIGPRTAIANWFIRKRPMAFGIYSTGNPAGGVVLIAPAAWLIANFGWRWVWVSMGLLQLLVITPLSWLIIRKRPEDMGLLPDGESVALQRAGDVPLEARRTTVEYDWTQREALRTPTFWLLVAGTLLLGMPSSSIFLHMVPFLQQRGLSANEAAAALSVYALIALLGRPVWGVIISKVGVRTGQVLFATSYGCAITGIVLAPGGLLLAGAVLSMGLVIGGLGQLQAQVWPDYFGRSIVGTLTGYATILTMPASAAGPWLVALVFDQTGRYDVIYSVFAGFAFTAGLFYYLARPPVPKSARASSGSG